MKGNSSSIASAEAAVFISFVGTRHHTRKVLAKSSLDVLSALARSSSVWEEHKQNNESKSSTDFRFQVWNVLKKGFMYHTHNSSKRERKLSTSICSDKIESKHVP